MEPPASLLPAARLPQLGGGGATVANGVGLVAAGGGTDDAALGVAELAASALIAPCEVELMGTQGPLGGPHGPPVQWGRQHQEKNLQ